MDLTFDTRIELATDFTIGYLPTLKGRRAVQPLLEARDAILARARPEPVTEAERAEAEADYLAQRIADDNARCRICDGSGLVLIADAGNQEMHTTCPECWGDR